jgi:tetratricopeptide (TPR) repeat protein
MGALGSAARCYNNGCDLLARKQYSEARREFERAIEQDPALVSAYLNLGNCLRRTGQEDKSLYYYIKAIDLDPRNTSAHYNYGIALYCLDMYEDAARELCIAVELEPSRSDLQYTFARYSATIGKTFPALKHAFRAITLKPGNPECYKVLIDVVLLSCLNVVIRKAGKTHR